MWVVIIQDSVQQMETAFGPNWRAEKGHAERKKK